jgi:hypothetical protein
MLRSGPAVLNRVLHVGTLEESVTVVARAPAPPAPVTAPPPRKVPEIAVVDEHASVCGPREATAETEAVARVVAVDQAPGRHVLGDRDLLLMDRGSADGIAVGQNLVVRRRFLVKDQAPSAGTRSNADQTAALVQVVETTATSATARAVYICNEIAVGDRLDPFESQPAWRAQDAGVPDFDDPGRVLFAGEGRAVAAPRDLLVIDRGSMHGARPGQWVTLFRGRPGTREFETIGHAIVVAVQPGSSTVRVETARDILEIGDAAALHRVKVLARPDDTIAQAQPTRPVQ